MRNSSTSIANPQIAVQSKTLLKSHQMIFTSITLMYIVIKTCERWDQGISLGIFEDANEGVDLRLASNEFWYILRA